MTKSKPTAPSQLRAAIYCRKSTTIGLEQDFNSIDAQREACEAYAKQQGWQVVPSRFDDGGFSGANLDRPAFKRLLTGIERKQFDIIVVHRLDRLSRSLSDFVGLMEKLTKYGVGFCCVTQNFDTSTPSGKLMMHMLLSFAEFERSMIVERTRDKMAASRRRGQWVGGTVPLGYRVENRKLLIIPQEAVAVRRCFNLFLEHGCFAEVARRLNHEGFKTKHHVSRTGRETLPRDFLLHDVALILRNPILAGLMPLGTETFPGEHEGIVTPDLFKHVQNLIGGSDQPKKRKRRNLDYLLTGLIHCKRCGHPMLNSTTKTRGVERRYYRCDSLSKRGHNCGKRNIPAKPVEEFVVAQVREAFEHLDLAAEVTAKARARLKQRRTSLESEKRTLPPRIEQLKKATKEAIREWSVHQLGLTKKGTPTYGQRMLDEALEVLENDIEALEERQVTVNGELHALAQIEIQQSWVETVMRDFGAVWTGLTPFNRTLLLKALLERVTVDANTGRIEVELKDIGDEAEDPSNAEAGNEAGNEAENEAGNEAKDAA